MRIVGIFALTSFVPLGALTFASLTLAADAVRREVKDGLISTASVGAAAVQREVEGLEQVVSSYAARRLLRQALAGQDPATDRATITRVLSELREVRDGVATTFIVDDAGRIVDIQPAAPDVVRDDMSSQQWFKAVTTTGRPYASAVHESETAGRRWVVAVVAPILRGDDSPALAGIVAAEYDVATIERFAQHIVADKSIELTVSDQRGTEVAAPASPVSRPSDLSDQPGVLAALRGDSRVFADTGPDRDKLSAYAPVENLGWTVIASVDESAAFAGLARLRSVVFTVAAALGLVLSAGLAFVVFLLRGRYRAEEELLASEHRFSELVEALPVGLLVRTADGKPYLANKEAHRLLGKGADRVTPERLAEEHEPFVAGTEERYPAERMPIVRALQGEDAMVEDMEVHRGDTVIPLEVRGAPIRDADGRLTYAVAMFTDITERREAQHAIERARAEAERANRAKSEFMSRMSHELRTPLNAILGFAQLLEMEPRSEEDEESVRTILKGGRHLLDLINELLDIARVESGELPISLEVVEVDEAVDEAIDLVRPLAESRNVTVAHRSEGDGRRYVTADRQRLKQVLLNLISNAVKYNREAGSVVASVETSAQRVRIRVADTGPGIAEDKLDRVFAPFDRLGAEDGSVDGTGLGLALSRSLVELMGGSIGVESALGHGSTFWVELPTAPDMLDDVAAAPAAQATGGAAVSRPSRTVLCIEDNVSSVRLLERVFEHRPNVRMLAATQGSLGFDLAKLHHPDLVLLDLNLPDMHGRDVLWRLHNDPQTADIPVVVLSADATPGQIKRLMEAGANDYLTKPINVQKTLEVLDEVLAHNAGS